MVAFGSLLTPVLLAFATNKNVALTSAELRAYKSMTDNDTKNAADNVPSKQTQQHDTNNIITKLRSIGMEKKETPHHTQLQKRASILVPLFQRGETTNDNNDIIGNSNTNRNSSSSILHVLFTQRPQHMKSHGGEVCFPGGKQDPEDHGDDIRTAFRETEEEVGILHSDHTIEAIARMSTLESKHGLCVTPIIGYIQPSSVAEPMSLKLNTDEVEAAFAVPLEYFSKPENCESAVKVEWRGGEFLLRTYRYDCPENGRQFKIWGLTAHVVHAVAALAFDKNEKED